MKVLGKLHICCFAMVLFGCTNHMMTLDNSSNSTNNFVIPFEISDANNIIFKAVLNDIDSIDLFFDTGGTDIVMRHAAIRENTTTLVDGNVEYIEEDFEPLGSLNSLSIGGLTFDSLTIYPVGVGPEEAAGHFGWNLFEGKIVSIDYEQQKLTVYESLNKIPAGYTKLPIEYAHTLFCIQASLKVKDKIYTNRYLFDTGFQKALLLDKDLNRKSNFPDSLDVIKESKLKNSAGDVFINNIVEIDGICFNDICAEKVPTHLLDLPNPAQFETHILGNELLMRFNTILDFKNHFVYLKPNKRISLIYSDAT